MWGYDTQIGEASLNHLELFLRFYAKKSACDFVAAVPLSVILCYLDLLFSFRFCAIPPLHFGFCLPFLEHSIQFHVSSQALLYLGSIGRESLHDRARSKADWRFDYFSLTDLGRGLLISFGSASFAPYA
ncbi:hypothetical protein RchiOBHm_Chr4g0402991 [Rosa chinensis]|uniref:Uncharacterized protein n=2 Tax=Rosa chinensis TaxID=74649 RepID=A0A2P6QTI6_ROSCH|nr:hypothetical protein RchiOBHm_Chr4g0402991 [Rosa chinensis]